MYTALGVVIVLIVSAIALHLMMSSQYEAAKHAEQEKVINTIEFVKKDIDNKILFAAHSAIWKVGHEIDGDGKNRYIGGEGAMTEAMREEIKNKINDYLCNGSKIPSECESPYTWQVEDIEVTIKGITKDNVQITKGDKSHFTVKITIPEMSISGYRGQTYKESDVVMSETITSRIYDMRKKGEDFHEGWGWFDYERTIWLSELAKGHAAGYCRIYLACNWLKRSIINVGDFTWDPTDQILRGDRKSLQDLVQNTEFGDYCMYISPPPVTGAIPGTTYLWEWGWLDEPSLCPPETCGEYNVWNKMEYDCLAGDRCAFLAIFGMGWAKYKDITYEERNEPVCAELCISVIISVVAMILSEGSVFQIDYHLQTEHKISETIVDEENKLILHNLASQNPGDVYGVNEDAALYSHVPAEFQIYKNHEVKIGGWDDPLIYSFWISTSQLDCADPELGKARRTYKKDKRKCSKCSWKRPHYCLYCAKVPIDWVVLVAKSWAAANKMVDALTCSGTSSGNC